MSWVFPGGANRLSASTTLLNIEGPFTVSMWVRQVASEKAIFGAYFSIYGSDTSDRFACQITASGLLNLREIINGVLTAFTWPGATLPDDEWSHLMIRHDGDVATPMMSLHVDGVFIAQAATSGTLAGGANIYIGSMGPNVGQECKIDSVKIWNRFLETGEIQTERFNRLPQTTTGLVGWYDLRHDDNRLHNFWTGTSKIPTPLIETGSVIRDTDSPPINYGGTADHLVVPDRSVQLAPVGAGFGEAL